LRQRKQVCGGICGIACSDIVSRHAGIPLILIPFATIHQLGSA
jgi:hypothetical protein